MLRYYGGKSCAPPQKILEFYPWKCHILVHFIIIRSNNYLWPLAHWGRGLASYPLK